MRRIETAASPMEIRQVSDLIVRGYMERARRSVVQLAERYPSDPAVTALTARMDAETNRTTFAEAEAIVRELVVVHSENMRLKTTAAYLSYRQGNCEGAISELREIASQTEEPVVHQTLAGFLHLSRTTWAESWEHYKIALGAGPLGSPCYRSAAFTVGSDVEPEEAGRALLGAGGLERAALNTRSRGAPAMFLVGDLFMVGAAGLRVGGLWPIGLVVAALGTCWGSWAAYSNHLVCCRRCRNVWLGYPIALWLVFAGTTHVVVFALVAVSAFSGTLVAAFRSRQARHRLLSP